MKNQMFIHLRNLLLGGFLMCAFLLLGAYALQFGFHLKPCFLCLLQRYMLILTAIIFFLALLHNSSRVSHYVYIPLAMFFTLLGFLISGRQIWIQNLPKSEVPSCTAGFEKLLQFHSAFDSFRESIVSSGECAKDVFILLGLSLAEWSLIGFIILLLYSAYLFSQTKKGRI